MTWDFSDEMSVDLEIVVNSAVETWGITRDKIFGKSRKEEFCAVRYMIWAKLSGRGHSSACIGKAFNRDHSTILHGLDQHQVKRTIQYQDDGSAIYYDKEYVDNWLTYCKNFYNQTERHEHETD